MIVGYLRGDWRQDRTNDIWHFCRGSDNGMPTSGSLCRIETARLGVARSDTAFAARICGTCWQGVFDLAAGRNLQLS